MEVEDKQADLNAPANQEDRLKKPVGDIEVEKLEAKKITVLSVTIETQKKKTGEVVGEMAHFKCKHPDKDDPIDVSKVQYLKNKKVTESGLWYGEDKEGNIQKGSALAQVINHYKAKDLESFVGQELETELNESGYLSIKAY